MQCMRVCVMLQDINLCLYNTELAEVKLFTVMEHVNNVTSHCGGDTYLLGDGALLLQLWRDEVKVEWLVLGHRAVRHTTRVLNHHRVCRHVRR